MFFDSISEKIAVFSCHFFKVQKGENSKIELENDKMKLMMSRGCNDQDPMQIKYLIHACYETNEKCTFRKHCLTQ